MTHQIDNSLKLKSRKFRFSTNAEKNRHGHFGCTCECVKERLAVKSGVSLWIGRVKFLALANGNLVIFRRLANWIGAMRPIDWVKFIELNWNQSIITIGIRQLPSLQFVHQLMLLFFLLFWTNHNHFNCIAPSCRNWSVFFPLLKESQSIVCDCGKNSCGNDFVRNRHKCSIEHV